MPNVSMLPKGDRISLVNYYKITKIIEAENKLDNNWKPNWNNSSQPKYSIWHYIKADAKRPAGFGFSNTHYGYTGTGTAVGSRLCFKSDELAKYAGTQFEKLFQDLLNP